VKYLFLLSALFFYSWTVQGQASSSGAFSFELHFSIEEFDVYNLSYLPRDGHVLKEIHAIIDQKNNYIAVKGKNEYVVGVPFPIIIIEKKNSPENAAIHQVIYMHQLVKSHASPKIMIDVTPKIGSIYKLDLSTKSNKHNDLYKAQFCDNEYCKLEYNTIISKKDQFAFLASASFENIQNKPAKEEPKKSFFYCYATEFINPKQVKAFSTRYDIDFQFMTGDLNDLAFAKAKQHNYHVALFLNRNYGKEWHAQLPVDVIGLFD
jgi:hypothetical protein